LAQDLVVLAEEVGVAVYSRADRRAVSRAASREKVLVFLGHFKGPRLEAVDLLIDVEEYQRLLRTAVAPLAREISSRILPQLNGNFADAPTTTQRKLLASIINEQVIEPDYPLIIAAGADGAFVRDAQWESCCAREALEAAFPNSFRPGNALELRDGYHQHREVLECVPDGWTGIMEFSICSSLYFAEKIKNGVSDRRIIVNKKEKLPDRCIRELMETFLLLTIEPMNYARARAKVFKEYSRIVANHC
jgi:hypothetical protein